MKTVQNLGKIAIGFGVAAASLLTATQPASALLINTFEFTDAFGSGSGRIPNQKVKGYIEFDNLNPGDSAINQQASSIVITEVPDHLVASFTDGNNFELGINLYSLPNIGTYSNDLWDITNGVISRTDDFDINLDASGNSGSYLDIDFNGGGGWTTYLTDDGFTNSAQCDGLSNCNYVFTDASAAAVPFEFSPTLGFLAVGGIFGISRLRKNIAAKKTIANLST